jgi:hypothetical protein
MPVVVKSTFGLPPLWHPGRVGLKSLREAMAATVCSLPVNVFRPLLVLLAAGRGVRLTT